MMPCFEAKGKTSAQKEKLIDDVLDRKAIV
jgi:hypothetical protein